jgi:outer membrane protein assembly factor BamB
MVFVLSSAGTRLSNAATLRVLDAMTGKDLYSGAVATSNVPAGGLAVANGRIYFAGRDNAVYCFGIPAQQEQLVKQ